jgi:rhamnosyltransferase
METSCIIPTFQAAQVLPNLVNSLHNQISPPGEIIIVDSSSSDDTLLIAQQFQCITHTLLPGEFKHGLARNLGARLAHGDILVFLTQDVLPVNNSLLSELTRPLREGRATAATARQVPYPTANPIESFTRAFNYPSTSHIRTIQDLPRMGIKTFFFSNSASAIDKDVFWSVGGFSEAILVNEDMELCARLLRRGLAIAYQAEAQVYHSHTYTLKQLANRYYDIGVFFNQANPSQAGISADDEGLRLVRSIARNLISNRAWTWLPRLGVESSIKYICFRLGYYHHRFPGWLKRWLGSFPNDPPS